ncbi:MAG: transposase-like protein [Pseudoalteromonas tetraodonis]|jgi:transposase-like protein
MPKYSIDRKESVLSKLLSPDRCSISELSRSEGISQQTLYAWRNKARQSGNFMPNKQSPDRWDNKLSLPLGAIRVRVNLNAKSLVVCLRGLLIVRGLTWAAVSCSISLMNHSLPQAIPLFAHRLKFPINWFA